MIKSIKNLNNQNCHKSPDKDDLGFLKFLFCLFCFLFCLKAKQPLPNKKYKTEENAFLRVSLQMKWPRGSSHCQWADRWEHSRRIHFLLSPKQTQSSFWTVALYSPRRKLFYTYYFGHIQASVM